MCIRDRDQRDDDGQSRVVHAVLQRFCALSICPRLSVRELLVDRADELDRNHLELVGEEAELPAFRIDSRQELRNPRQVVSGRCRFHQRRRKHIAVEGLGQPCEQLAGRWPVAQSRRQRRAAAYPLQPRRTNDLAVWPSAVSYTHLDVYKRQEPLQRCNHGAAPGQ